MLSDLIFGEAALNDALSIVLFNVFKEHLHLTFFDVEIIAGQVHSIC